MEKRGTNKHEAVVLAPNWRRPSRYLTLPGLHPPFQLPYPFGISRAANDHHIGETAKPLGKRLKDLAMAL